jgi:hypothetical protein
MSPTPPPHPSQGGGDAVPQRLRGVILRIVGRSLTKYRPLIMPAAQGGSATDTRLRQGPGGSIMWHSGNMYGMLVRHPWH